MRKLFILMLMTLGLGTVAQHQIQATLVDAIHNKAIPGVQIQLNDSDTGTLTDHNGTFRITVQDLKQPLRFSHIGYAPKTIQAHELVSREPAVINLYPLAVELDEIMVFSDRAIERFSPVSFSNIEANQIQAELGDRPLPEIMQRTPGIYAVRDGGGSGDASVSIRGFQQENIAVLLNGVPINGAENGLLYWNNWLGLTEATSSIQVQRGIGVSKVALNSVGGTINIITKSTEAERGGSFSHNLSSYGNRRSTFAYNTGLTESGWALTLLGSRTYGQGYIDGTYVDGWAYFLGLSRQFGANHKIVFTALGGPERHGQRNLMLSQDEIERYGYLYNKEWGSYNGQINNASENFYHKPHLAVNHYWGLNEKSVLSTSVYFTPGWGGGKWSDSYRFGPGLFDFKNPSGQIDWDAIYQYNSQHQDVYVTAEGDSLRGFSKLAQTHFLASHIWTGVLSSIDMELNPRTRLVAGVHYRYFESKLRQKVVDLLGGDFYIDDYSWSLAGRAGRNEIKMPGDIIRINNGAILHNSSVFAQLEKTFGALNAFIGGTLSDNRYRRNDPYNHPDQPLSEWIPITGYDLKAGINYNIDRMQQLYVNAGHFNKAPYYKFVFGNFTNVPVKDRRNEKVNTAELGYAYQNRGNYFKTNVYYTLWQDVSFLTNEYIQLENNAQTRAMVSGLEATHYGIEAETEVRLLSWFSLGAWGSAGNWQWTNDVEAKIFDDADRLVDTVEVFANGLYVGGQPQLQLGLFAEAELLNFITLQVGWNYFDRHYANFDPAGRQNPDNRSQSYRLPAYHLLDGHLQFRFPLFGTDCQVFASGFNLLDQHYILRGEDGADHDRESFRGFWSFGRTFNFGMKLSF